MRVPPKTEDGRIEAEQFARLLRTGARAARGMPAYADITDQELTALQHYIRQQAEAALRQKP